jgi:hypothetical protein
VRAPRFIVMPKFLFTLIVSFFLINSDLGAQIFKNGDIIFIQSTSGQGKAIQLATKSKFTHVGIIFIENGQAMVYHAVEPVSKNTMEEFLAMSNDGQYQIRSLKDQSVLTKEVVDKMHSEARADLGKHYDIYFNWSDKELYCSEFVWKLYKNAVGLDVGKLRPLKDFDLSHPVVKAKLKQRYGDNIPLNENMISPGDMYDSALLQ